MNHQAIKKNFFLVLACVAGCQAQAQPPTAEFSTVFSAISSKQVFNSSFATIIKKLKGVCTEREASHEDYLRKGNVLCVEAASVNRLTLSGSGDLSLSMVQSSFRNVEKCAYMKDELIRRYGKPRSSDGICAGEWRISMGKNNPLRIIKLKASKEAGLVFFTYQEEQGP